MLIYKSLSRLLFYGNYFQMIYNKWWKHGTVACPKSDGDRSKASSLNVVNIGGVFVVLFCGLVFAILVAIVEFCVKMKGEASLHPSIKVSCLGYIKLSYISI